MSRAGSLLWLALLLILFSACHALAQQDTGGLVVSVRDPNRAAVPGARVTVTNIGTNQEVEGITGDTGDFIASPLRPGQYKATVKREGFVTAVSEIVSV